MTRLGFAALLLLAMLAPACGKYGPPVRSVPMDDARVSLRAREEPATDPSRDADEQAQVEAPSDAPDDADEKAREETPR